MSMLPEAWNFPCFHGIKAIGLRAETVQAVFISLIKNLQLAYNKESIAAQKSRNGKYTSITIEVYFNNAQEVKALYSKLHDHSDIVQSL